MEPNNISVQTTKLKTSAKDFFLNLGAIVALYTVIFNLINLLFTVINKAYPQITNGYYYNSSSSISFPVATLIIFFPIFVLLMWLLEKGYVTEPFKKHLGIRKWLTYITLFIAGLTFAGDLVMILYYFIDGQELTTGFILKAITVLILTGLVFYYYISDIREKLNSICRKIWLAVSCVLILASIIWGFSVLGSPHTQQLLKYDEQKVNDLQSIDNAIRNFTGGEVGVPDTISSTDMGQYYLNLKDKQTNQPYEYHKTSTSTYQLCATFNETSDTTMYGNTQPVIYGGTVFAKHPAGHYCFDQTVTPNNIYPIYPKPVSNY